MEFRQLEAYIHVYEQESFSKAAEKMYLSQPSISAYINALESKLNTQLIYRSTKEFIPTKSGVLLYKYAKEMLALRDKSIYNLKTATDANAGNIEIFASSVPMQHILPQIIGDFHQLYPNIIFNLKQMDSMEVIKAIASYKGEIGFVGAKTANPKCSFQEFMSEKLIMIAPNENRFKNISPDSIVNLIKNEYFIMREEGSGTRIIYEDFFKKIGVSISELNISAYINSTQSIISAVANGLGLSIVSELTARQHIEQETIIPIDIDFLPARNFYITMRNNRIQAPIVDNFIEFVLSYNL